MHIPTVIASLRGEANCYGQEDRKMAERIREGQTQYESHRQACETAVIVLSALAQALEYGTDDRAIAKIIAKKDG